MFFYEDYEQIAGTSEQGRLWSSGHNFKYVTSYRRHQPTLIDQAGLVEIMLPCVLRLWYHVCLDVGVVAELFLRCFPNLSHIRFVMVTEFQLLWLFLHSLQDNLSYNDSKSY